MIVFVVDAGDNAFYYYIRQKQMMKIEHWTAAADAAAWFYWRDRNDGGSKALVTAPSDADRTNEAYFARTPLV